MYTIEDVRRYIGNAAYFARGQNYLRDGRVNRLTAEDEGGRLRIAANVRGHMGARYNAFVEYDEAKGVFLSCGCDCPAFAGAETGCKHVAAVALAAVYQRRQVQASLEDAQRREREAVERQRKWEENRRELMRRQQEEAEQTEREERRRFVDALVMRASMKRTDLSAPAQTEGEAALALTLTPADGGVHVEMKAGITRMYVVRSFDEFAARMAHNARFTYGKELTLTHREDAFRAQDRPLLRLIALTLAPGQTGGVMTVSGANLDALMRALAERGEDVDVRLGGQTVRVPLIAGEREIAVHMQENGEGASLRVDAGNAVMGAAGIYFFDADAIRCAEGDAFGRLSGLMDVAGHYPGGLALEGDMLAGVCAQVIAPARGMIAIKEGAQLIAANTPDEMMPRYYVDIADGKITCRTRFVYGETETAPDEVTPDIRRDRTLEDAAVAAMRALFTQSKGPGEAEFAGDEDACFELITQRLPQLERRGEVMVSEQISRMNVKTRRAMRIGLSVQGDKLLVKADLGGYTQDELREAYYAHRQRRRFVRLKSGAFLSGEALEQAADAAQVLESIDMTAEQAEAGGETQAARALYLDQALKDRESIKLRAPKAVNDWIERIKAAQTAQTAHPKTLKAALYSYQLTGMAWMCALADAGFSGILADDMGLGKTMQALAMLLTAKERGETVRALVVCPASLQLNWKKEAAKFAPALAVKTVSGSAEARAELIRNSQDVELLIASYDQIRRDVQAYEGIELTHILLDEAQYIKNAASQAAKSVKTLKGSHKFAMTGTPIENRLSELWSIFDFLMPGYLLTYKKFKERFESPIVRDKDEKAQERLRQMCAPFILRRMKADVLTDLPEKVESTMMSEMTDAQKRLYAAHAARLVAEAEGGIGTENRMRVLAGLTRLRQLCCDPRLCLEDYAGGSGKFDQCIDVVLDALEGGHSVLLFSQFTSMLELLKETLDDEGVTTFMLTGDTEKAERMDLVERFNAGEARVFLISLKAGGTGLNLTGADVVIHYDPWWNTAAQNQATDRAYRIGQTRGVQVIKLIAEDTIEERILKLQEAKSRLAGSVLGEENLFTIDTDTLRELLR